MPRSANCGRLMPPGAAFCPVFSGAFTVRFVTFSVVNHVVPNGAGSCADFGPFSGHFHRPNRLLHDHQLYRGSPRSLDPEQAFTYNLGMIASLGPDLPGCSSLRHASGIERVGVATALPSLDFTPGVRRRVLGGRLSQTERSSAHRQMAGRQCTVAKFCDKLLQVDSGKEQDRLVCFQQILVDRMQVAKHHVTTVIGIATEVVLQVEGVGQSIA